jgi:hypothetical protein
MPTGAPVPRAVGAAPSRQNRPPHGQGQGFSLCLRLRQPDTGEAFARTVDPLRIQIRSQPFGNEFSQGVEDVAERLPHAFQTVERPHGHQDMSGIGALLAFGLEPTAFAGQSEKHVEQAGFRLPFEEPSPKLAEYREVKAGIGQLQGQSVLSIDAALDGLGRLPIRETFGKLHHRDQCQTPGRQPGLTFVGKKIRKLGIGKEGTKLVSHREIEAAFGKGGLGDLGSLFRNGLHGLGT